MSVLMIETETGREKIAGISEWGWQKESGDLYYRQGKELIHIEKVLNVQEIQIGKIKGLSKRRQKQDGTKRIK